MSKNWKWFRAGLLTLLVLGPAAAILPSLATAGGIVLTPIPKSETSEARASFLDASGRIVLAGKEHGYYTYNLLAVVRYRANGTLDTTFDNDGIVVTEIAQYFARCEANAVAADPVTGKIVAAGAVIVGGTMNQQLVQAIARYNDNGSLDKGFNKKGTLKNDQLSSATGVVVQSDSKIVTVDWGFNVARYTSAGKLDTTFNITGVVPPPFGPAGGNATALTLHQGRFLAVGRTSAQGTADFALARYNSNGTLDTTFGDTDLQTGFRTGKVITDIGFQDSIWAVAVGPPLSPYQDYIVVAGQTGWDTFPGRGSLALARYRPDGTLDPTFGNGGIVAPYGGEASYPFASAVGIQPDGKIVMHMRAAEFSFVTRYNADGSLDDQFGAAGTVITPVIYGGWVSLPRSSVLIQPQSGGTFKIIVSGTSAACFAMARYNEDGSLDESFGDDP